MKQTQNFTEGKIFAPLVRFALPVLVALLLQTMYGAVDLLVVGQFGTAADVSAVSTGSQVMHTVTVVITGLAMGLTVLVGRKIGEGHQQEAGQIIGSGIWLFAALAAVVTVAMMFASDAMATLMHAPAAAHGKTVDYIKICSAGSVFIVAYNLIGSIFRGIGDSKVPLMTVAIACVLNIGGDLLLVAGLGLGAAGAAIATVFAQAASVVLSLAMIRRRSLPFTFSRRELRPQRGLIGKILLLGTPVALQDLLVSISFLAILAIINDISLMVSAGVGVAEKLCGFVMLVPSAYMQSMSAFVAQNMGAGKPQRARKALLCGIASSFLIGIVIAYFVFFHGDLLAGIFSRETDVIAVAAEYLKAYAIDCLLVSFLFCFIGYFNGCGSTLFVMLQGIVGAFLVRIPVSSLMSQAAEPSVFHIGLATPASTVVQILLCGIWFVWLSRRQKRQLPRH